MAEANVAISAENKDAAAEKSVAAGKEMAAKKGYAFESFLAILALIVVLVGAYESLTEMFLPAWSLLSSIHRFGYMKDYPILYEPSKGIWHPIGWTGSAMMAVMMLYSVRKRVAAFGRLGPLRHWLSAHMFLGIMGPILVTFHTTFKLHGLVATSFWCMIVTMIFGVLGRYIYVQIPRGINGTELGVKEIENSVSDIDIEIGRKLKKINISNLLNELGINEAGRFLNAMDKVRGEFPIDSNDTDKDRRRVSNLLKSISTVDVRERGALPALFFLVWTDIKNYFKLLGLRSIFRIRFHLGRAERDEIITLLESKAALIRRKSMLVTSHKLLHHWHVLHVPLAIVMFLIMFMHIIVYYIFRAAH
ncbi:MAG: hypothetical protein HY954_11010 [Deltaproteobacteria bacterium]|nr:hypothetical protein [Deltaproteobacteria bacterium]